MEIFQPKNIEERIKKKEIARQLIINKIEAGDITDIISHNLGKLTFISCSNTNKKRHKRLEKIINNRIGIVTSINCYDNIQVQIHRILTETFENNNTVSLLFGVFQLKILEESPYTCLLTTDMNKFEEYFLKRNNIQEFDQIFKNFFNKNISVFDRRINYESKRYVFVIDGTKIIKQTKLVKKPSTLYECWLIDVFCQYFQENIPEIKLYGFRIISEMLFELDFLLPLSYTYDYNENLFS